MSAGASYSPNGSSNIKFDHMTQPNTASNPVSFRLKAYPGAKYPRCQWPDNVPVLENGFKKPCNGTNSISENNHQRTKHVKEHIPKKYPCSGSNKQDSSAHTRYKTDEKFPVSGKVINKSLVNGSPDTECSFENKTSNFHNQSLSSKNSHPNIVQSNGIVSHISSHTHCDSLPQKKLIKNHAEQLIFDSHSTWETIDEVSDNDFEEDYQLNESKSAGDIIKLREDCFQPPKVPPLNKNKKSFKRSSERDGNCIPVDVKRLKGDHQVPSKTENGLENRSNYCDRSIDKKSEQRDREQSSRSSSKSRPNSNSRDSCEGRSLSDKNIYKSKSREYRDKTGDHNASRESRDRNQEHRNESHESRDRGWEYRSQSRDRRSQSRDYRVKSREYRDKDSDYRKDQDYRDRSRDYGNESRDYKGKSQSYPNRNRGNSNTPGRGRSPHNKSSESPNRAQFNKVSDNPIDSSSREVSIRHAISSAPLCESKDDGFDEILLPNDDAKWIRSSSSELFYSHAQENDTNKIEATEKLKELHKTFQEELIDRAEIARAAKPKYEPPQRKKILRKPKPPKTEIDEESSTSEEESSSDEDTAMEELEKKKKHPHRLHPELWFNDPKEMNDGPLCRCSAKAGRSGIRHGIYIGEEHLPVCNPLTNNADRLFHYRITMTPRTNFMTKCPTTIEHEGHKYTFEGFSMFSHLPLPKLPNCKVIRFNYEYTILYIEEKFPENFTIQDLDLFNNFLLMEILELVDLNWKAHEDPNGCPRFHFMPRFARDVEDDGKELLSMNTVLEYLLKCNKPLIEEQDLEETLSFSQRKWQKLADDGKGMIVTCPGVKPSSLRVDQLDREHDEKYKEKDGFPVIVHFGVRPPQLSYAGNPAYQKAWRSYVKYRHLLANKPKVKYQDRHKLTKKEQKLQEMRMENDLKRDVTVVVSSKGFYKTGIMSDIIQHAMLLPVLVVHLRFHQSLTVLEERIGYKFKDRYLLQIALTHPSYRENFGTNPDHARNSLTNCGLRQPQYGDRRIHYMNTRKRGINTLINIMSRFGSKKETASHINHNERLEFLGDAVVEFLSSIHLFFMFSDLEEGGLATYRAAIVQNQHLAVLSKKLQLEKFMLYAHGSDLCHDLELRHAMANCFEALMGALFLDDGIDVADKVFSTTLFHEPDLLEVWTNYPPHPLQEQEPGGDRKWIVSVPILQKLNDFENTIGIEFTHIRLLARALTHRSLGYNNLTLGSNQRLEFLGDTVLQLVASEYLYKFFPEHHEGHLSLLRSSLVNNRTQAVVCGDLGMIDYAIYPYFKVELKTKDRADLLEAFLGALYVDKDLGFCRKFCEVCFFPRLQDFIMNQDWNDPKSKLQQCCLTLRSMDGGEPDIPTYKVIECKGPTNTRVYSVAVYFQGNRLAVGNGHSIQQAEMDAASNALRKSRDLFPQLRHQRRAIQRSLKQGPPKVK